MKKYLESVNTAAPDEGGIRMLATTGITRNTIKGIAEQTIQDEEKVEGFTDETILIDKKNTLIGDAVTELMHSLDKGPFYIASWEDSLKILGSQGENPEQERVTRIMRDVLQDKIFRLEGAFTQQDKKVKDAATNLGLQLEKNSKLFECL